MKIRTTFTATLVARETADDAERRPFSSCISLRAASVILASQQSKRRSVASHRMLIGYLPATSSAASARDLIEEAYWSISFLGGE